MITKTKNENKLRRRKNVRAWKIPTERARFEAKGGRRRKEKIKRNEVFSGYGSTAFEHEFFERD
jgi:hypothetical protein